MAELAQRLTLPPIAAPTVQVEIENETHTPQFASFKASLMWSGDRRLQAETYMASGYGLRLAIESQAEGWLPFGKMARVSQPARTKAVLVGAKYGTPFLVAGQMFSLRPQARKWLAIEKLAHSKELFVQNGDILVRRSADVGRATLALKIHENHLISDHFLRVDALETKYEGWVYAFIRSPQGRSMMKSAKYGHIIQHIEISHLKELPIPIVNDAHAADFTARVQAILDARNEGHSLAHEAENRFEEAIGSLEVKSAETGFSVSSSVFSKKRRRFEANYHSPQATGVLDQFRSRGLKTQPLKELASQPYSMGRKKIYFGEGGMRYLSADEIFAVNPSESKKILVAPGDGHEAHFVQEGWIVMACSGQIYGLNGSALLVTKSMENIFFSQDLIRIIPNADKIRSGYLLTALTHPVLGRPLLIRAAYGTSIPHLDPNDVSAFPVVRLSAADENAIADLAEASAASRAKADVLERALSHDAGILLDRFIAGEMSDFQME